MFSQDIMPKMVHHNGSKPKTNHKAKAKKHR